MSDPSSSYASIHHSTTQDDFETEEIDSLPSSSAGSSTSVSPSEEEAISDAEREWQESLEQLQLLLTMVLCPYVGKYFGRKFAYWGMSVSKDKGNGTMADKWYRMGKVHGVEVSSHD